MVDSKPRRAGRSWLLPVLLVAGLALLVFDHLFFRGIVWSLRWSLLGGLLLVLLPGFMTRGDAGAAAGNLLELRRTSSLLGCLLLLDVAAGTIWATGRATLVATGTGGWEWRHFGLRTWDDSLFWGLPAWSVPGALICALVAIPLSAALAEGAHGQAARFAHPVALVNIGVAATAGPVLESFLQLTLVSEVGLSALVRRLFPDLIAPNLHVTLALLLGLEVALLALLGVLADPRRRRQNRQPEALLHVLALLAFVLLMLPGSVLLLGALVGPPELALVLLFLFGASLSTKQHHAHALDPAPQEAGAWSHHADAARKRLARASERWPGGDAQPAVVVFAHGGGIQAAAWTTRVLEGLAERTPSFADHLVLMSGVSGGALGLAYSTLDLRSELDRPFARAGTAARTGSLDALTWALLHQDILRAPFARERDRATALEHDWAAIAAEQGLPSKTKLGDLRASVASGALPGVVLNSTVFETGEPFTFSPLGFPPLEDNATDPTDWWGADNPEHRDIAWLSAARLAATFPYVTPMASAGRHVGRTWSPVHRGYHFADGGYFDNAGMFTAGRWIDAVLQELLESEACSSLLLVEINGFQEGEAPDAASAFSSNWLGPASLLVRERTSSQHVRNARSIDEFEQRFDGQFEHLEVRWPKEVGDGRQPLTWQLSEAQIRDVEEAWQTWLSAHDKDLDAFAESLPG